MFYKARHHVDGKKTRDRQKHQIYNEGKRGLSSDSNGAFIQDGRIKRGRDWKNHGGWLYICESGAQAALKASIRQPHLPDKMAAFGISGAKRRGLAALFATHPDIDDRITTIEALVFPDYKYFR